MWLRVGLGWGGMLMFTGTCKQRTGGFGVGWDVKLSLALANKGCTHPRLGWSGYIISQFFSSLLISQLFSAFLGSGLSFSQLKGLTATRCYSCWANEGHATYSTTRVYDPFLWAALCVCVRSKVRGVQCTDDDPDSQFCWLNQWNPQFCGFHLLVKSQFCWLDPRLNDQKKTPCLVNSIMSRTGSTHVDRQLSNRAQGLPLRFNGGTPHSWMFWFHGKSY